MSQDVQATGTINAVTPVQVGSQVSGTIAKLFADFNTQVAKDQVVAQIDPAIFRAQLLQAEADLENARANVTGLLAQIETQRAELLAQKANVDKAQAQLTDARLNLQRTKDLFDQGIVAAALRDTAQSNYDGALASLHVAQAQYERSEARLKTTIAFDNPEKKLFPGMTAYVSIPVAWENNVIKIPNGALRFQPELSDEERKALFARNNIPEGPRGGAGGRLASSAAAGGNAPAKSAGTMRKQAQGGSGVEAGPGSPSVAPAWGMGAGGSSQRDDWGIVWKLLPDKTLQPVRVKLGVTDFTFTAMEEGILKVGDELAIGQTSKNNSSAQAPGGSRPSGPMSGPGGLRRRM